MAKLTYTVRQLAEFLGAQLEGDGSAVIEGIASIDEATPAQVTFAADGKFAARLAQSRAGAAIVATSSPAAAPMPLLRVANVQASLVKLLTQAIGREDVPAAGVHPTAFIAPTAQLAPDVAVGPGAVVGDRTRIGARSVLCANVCLGSDVEIGEDTILFEGVVVRWACRLGSRVRVGPNSVIGYEGFGYFFADGKHNRIPHVGDVVLEDDVELGACTTVDRAKFGTTRIATGTKIDNQVQVAHNVQIGPHGVIAAQVGIAGSTRLGEGVILGGGCGIRDNITIGNHVTAAAFSAVANDIEDGITVAGIPAVNGRDAFRQVQAATRLPALLKQVRDLESRLRAIESAKND